MNPPPRRISRGYSGVGLAVILITIAPEFAGAQDRERKESTPGPYCGLFCLQAALNAIGKDVAFESLLRPRYLSSPDGSSVNELRQAAIDAGVHAVALAGLSVESLRGAQNPMILHVAKEGQLSRYDHWVLFCGMAKDKARILDAPNLSVAAASVRWSVSPSGAKACRWRARCCFSPPVGSPAGSQCPRIRIGTES